MALWIRLIDVLFESASFLPENSILRDLNIVSCAPGQTRCNLADVISRVVRVAAEKGPVTSEFNRKIQCDENSLVAQCKRR